MLRSHDRRSYGVENVKSDFKWLRLDDLRFFLFLPATLSRLTRGSWDPGGFGVLADCDGAGVADDRPAVADAAGVSGTVLSETAVGRTNDLLEWSAVVRMAFNSSMLFCFLFVGLWPTGAPLFSGLDDGSVRLGVARVSGVPTPPSWARFLAASAVVVASLIGQTKPVRGAYAGRCSHRTFKEVWSACSDVN